MCIKNTIKLKINENLEQMFKWAGEIQKAQNIQHSSFKDIKLRAVVNRPTEQFLFLKCITT